MILFKFNFDVDRDMFKRYEQLLDSELSEDYWSDLGICQAASLIAEFKETDWAHLQEVLPDKSPEWLVRWAETLGDSENKPALGILLVLAEMTLKEVREASLESIASQNKIKRRPVT